LTERSREVALVEAFPLENLKPIPIRSRLDSIVFADEPTVDLPEQGKAPSRSKPAPAASSSNDEVPALAQQAFFKRRGLVPFVAGAAAVLSILGVMSLFGSNTPDATEERSPGAQPKPSPPLPVQPPVTTAAQAPPPASATPVAAPAPKTPIAPAPAQPRAMPKAKPAPVPKQPAPTTKKNDREGLWGRK
jgi:hypothetical protein